MYQDTLNKALNCHRKGNFEEAISHFQSITNSIDIINYLLIGRKNEIPKDTIVQTFYNIGVCYKEWAEKLISLGKLNFEELEHLFKQAIENFRSVLVLTTVHEKSTTNIVSISSTLCTLRNENINYCISKLQDALFYDPGSPIVHYNLGFMFQRANKLEASIIHYRLAIRLIDDKKDDISQNLKLNCYYGISCVYRSIKQWPEALYYSLQGARIYPNDPDINNQLGVIYTEMRRTDLAENCYTRAIKHYNECRITHKTNAKGLLSDLYLNFGQMHSYNGDTNGSIECYNKSLEYNPTAILAFQNKIMNLNYIFDQLPDPLYIRKQHTLINKLLHNRNTKLSLAKNEKIRIGFVSGDYIDHPVSYFILGLIKQIDRSRFEVYAYSETMIDMAKFPKEVNLVIIKNKTVQEVFDIIHCQHKVDILFDLSGHTAANRLDIFAYRCAPIQITYLGYPNTTGIKNMDYRLTDSITDPEEKVENYYTEKLIRLPNCFLNYYASDHTMNNYPDKLPLTNEQPFLKNGFITFGCFNRLNKISSNVIKSWNQILKAVPNSIIRFKTKALLNKKIINTFLENFEESLRSRIDIIECTTNHQKHLLTYNDIDIALDTFPYSGTTTSCEALLMGVPVLTLRDSSTYFHAQNVTCSILKNSGEDLSYYIADTIDDIVNKCKELQSKDSLFWKSLKQTTRSQFINGRVCNTKEFTQNFEKLMESLVKQMK